MSKNIFSKIDLYNICLAEFSAQDLEEKTGIPFGWQENTSNELEDLYNLLNDKDQLKFDKKVKKVVKEFKYNFRNLPENISTKEDLEYLEECKCELCNKLIPYLYEFLEN